MFPLHFPVLTFPFDSRKTNGVFSKTIVELIDDGRETLRPVIVKSKEIFARFRLHVECSLGRRPPFYKQFPVDKARQGAEQRHP